MMNPQKPMSDEPDPDADRREPDVELVAEHVDDIIAANAFAEFMGNASRSKILAVLAGNQTPVNPTAITDAADISRDTFYNQFDVLKKYNVVEQVGTAGSAPLYKLTDTDLARAIEMVADHAGELKRSHERINDGVKNE